MKRQLTLKSMTETEFRAYAAEAIASYASEKVASGEWSKAESFDLARKSFEQLLPQGLETPNSHLFTLNDAEAGKVGKLWIAIQRRAGRDIAYVYDVLIEPEYQRKGFATAAFLALEEKARSLGLSGIALHVFGHNAAARALYEKLGYEPTNINLHKRLS